MKKVLTVIVACLLLLSYTQFIKANNEGNEGIKFTHGTWKEVVSKAKKENKLIFVDCYTVWCGPCKMLAKNVFPQKVVGDYFNANFINVKIDCEKGEGESLKTKFGVSAFPTMLFIDPKSEKVLHRVVGMRKAPELIDEAKGAPAKYKEFQRLEKAFNKKKKDIETVEAYLNNLIQSRHPKAKEIALHYLCLIPKTKWHEKDYWWIFKRYVKDPFSSQAKYYFENKEQFSNNNAQEAINYEYGLYHSYAGGLARVAKKSDFDQDKMNQLIMLMKEQNFRAADKVKAFCNRTLLISTQSWDEYVTVLEKDFDSGLKTNNKFYVERGFSMLSGLKNCEDPAVYKRVVELMDKVIEQQSKNEVCDMFALKIIYRDAYRYLQKAGIEGDKLIAIKAVSDFLESIQTQHRNLLDQTFQEGSKVENKGEKKAVRGIPMMKMGGY